jgi:hypothetical protein
VQGCQMVNFRTKNPNLGRFWRVLEWKMLVYFMPIWNKSITAFFICYAHLVILWSFGLFFPVLVYCVKKNLATLVLCRTDFHPHFSFLLELLPPIFFLRPSVLSNSPSSFTFSYTKTLFSLPRPTMKCNILTKVISRRSTEKITK